MLTVLDTDLADKFMTAPSFRRWVIEHQLFSELLERINMPLDDSIEKIVGTFILSKHKIL